MIKKFNFNQAVKKKQIIPFFDGPKIIKKEFRHALDDLEDAKEGFKRKKFKWSTVQAYYSIFHAARSLLYIQGYRENSHIKLAEAVKYFYIDNNLLPQKYYDYFFNGLILREMADYKGEFSKDGAEQNIKSAEEVLKLTKNIITKKEIINF